jgi:hypothetical protein
MVMPDGAISDISFAVQSAKGTAAASPTYKCYLAGGGLVASRSVGLLDTLDSSGFPTRADYAARYVTGEITIFARPQPLGVLLYAALGAKAVTGAGPFTHTFTASATRPWLTFWQQVGNGTLIEQFVDCRIARLVIASAAGDLVRVTASIVGQVAKWRTANPGTTVTTTEAFAHRHGSGLLTVDSVVTAGVREITVDIDNGDRVRPGGLGQGWAVVGGADRRGTITTTQRVVNDDRYAAFHYGSSTPADLAVEAVTPSTGSVDFIWRQSAAIELHIDAPALTPAVVGGITPNVDHSPLFETWTYLARYGGATSAIRARLINDVASY